MVEGLAMTDGAWTAILSIAVVSAFSLLGLVIQALLAAFHFGKHAQRLAAVEERTRSVDSNNAALAVLASTVGGIDKRLAEVALDVKNLLTGRVSAASRKEPEG